MNSKMVTRRTFFYLQGMINDGILYRPLEWTYTDLWKVVMPGCGEMGLKDVTQMKKAFAHIEKTQEMDLNLYFPLM